MTSNQQAARELLPCPFCGGTAWVDGGFISEYHGRSHIDVYVECKECGARGAEVDDADPDQPGYADAAIAAWNRRPPRPTQEGKDDNSYTET